MPKFIRHSVRFYFFQMSDIIACRDDTCPESQSENAVKLSLDGVSESRSSNISLDVYSAKFNNCKTVYPVRIIHPLCKLSVNYLENLTEVLTDVQTNNCLLTHVIADNPKRAFLRNSLSHGARFACEYCIAQGVALRETPEIQKQLQKCEAQQAKLLRATTIPEEQRKRLMSNLTSLESKLRKCTKIVWPHSTDRGEKRTIEDINRIVTEIEQSGDFKDNKGILGSSPLLNYPNFHFINGIPTEYLHFVCILSLIHI